jgi:hypothetical protein
MKTVSIFVFCVMLGGCVATKTLNIISPMYEQFDNPPLEEQAVVNIGDTVLRKGERYTFDAITVASPLSINGPGLMPSFEIPAQTMPAKFDFQDFVFYQGQNIIVRDLGVPRLDQRAGICVHKTDPDWAKAWVGVGAACVGPSVPREQIQKTTTTAISSPSFVQEIIYNGRVGSSIKFLYREFSGNIARPAFDQEVQYDLNDSNIIGFKQARIEILNATNTELTYRVLESFPDQ